MKRITYSEFKRLFPEEAIILDVLQVIETESMQEPI